MNICGMINTVGETNSHQKTQENHVDKILMSLAQPMHI